LKEWSNNLATLSRRLARLEHNAATYLYENTVPVSQTLALMDDMVVLFQSWTTEPYAPEMAALVRFFADPLRDGDEAELRRRLALWESLDDEERLALLRTRRGANL
jgi:hypothetical protein